MKAEEMRKITEQTQIENSNKFWETFKIKLFEGMKKQAECRCSSIVITCKDELGKTSVGASWVDYKPLREKVIEELRNLGYEVKYINAQQGEHITISWS